MSPTDPPPPNYPPPPGGGYGSEPPAGGFGAQPPAGQFDVGDAFRWGWKKFQENLGPILIATIVLIAAVVVLQIVSSIVTGAIFGNGVDPIEVNRETGEITGGDSRGLFGQLFISVITGFLSGLVGYLVQAAIIRGTLKIADGDKPEAAELFATDKIVPTLVTAAIVMFGTYVGLLLCILPGIIFGIFTAFSLYFLIDKNLEPVAAIKASFNFVKDNIGQLILLFLASFAAIIVGALLCGIGLLVAIPVVILANTYAFRTLTGGRVAA